jgi:hypothetical protein
MFSVGLPNALQAHHAQAGAGWLGESELDALEVGLWLFGRIGFQTGNLLLFGFSPRGHGGLSAEAVDECLKVGDLALAVAMGCLLLPAPGHALDQEVVVVAVVAVEAAWLGSAGSGR